MDVGIYFFLILCYNLVIIVFFWGGVYMLGGKMKVIVKNENVFGVILKEIFIFFINENEVFIKV